MTETWDTEFEKGVDGEIVLKFEKIRRGKARRSGPANRLIPYGTKIYPVQVTMLQTRTWVFEDIELGSPYVGGGTTRTEHVEVTRIVQEALFYKSDFGWRFSPGGAKTTLISSS